MRQERQAAKGYLVALGAVVALGSLAFLPTPALAQTSGLGGVVRDPSGAVLPGVTVEAASPALIEKVRTAVTDAQGRYRITSLRPGTYSLTFTLTGFSTARREGVELTTDFTATIDAELRLGALEETVTVSGRSPVVDVQNTAVRNLMPREVLDELPTARASGSIMSLVPGVLPESAGAPFQDVGGTKGEQSIRSIIHGGRGTDHRQLVDGLDINHGYGPGSFRAFQPVYESAEEVSVKLGGGTAEYSTGGIMVDFIPKDGGNTFKGNFLVNFTNNALQGKNLTDELVARGLSTVNINEVQKIYDISGHLGGPLKRDRLWFFTSHRKWVAATYAASIFENKTLDSWFYTPDFSRPGLRDYDNYTNNIRLTWQVSQKDKLRLSFDHQWRCDCHSRLQINQAPEAVPRNIYTPNEVFMATWSRPSTSKLLYEAGVVATNMTLDRQFQTGAEGLISVLELSNNLRYRSPASISDAMAQTLNTRLSGSYVTGSHAFKVGMNTKMWWHDATIEASDEINYTFRDGVPTEVTLYAMPVHFKERVNLDLGVYAQDQWTIQRLTLNAGLRLDYFDASVSAQTLPAGRFVPARSFPGVECTPCFRDLAPRFSVAYDLFGTGKTALKASWGKYVGSVGTNLARDNNPQNTTVRTATRAWTDRNGDYIPQEDELGPLSNVNFGQQVVRTHYAPEVLTGWGNREFSRQASASIDHELLPGVAIGLGYFRTSWHNFTVIDNLAIGPEDYDPYCITTAVDSRLPGGGGSPLCGNYDIRPAKFGLSDNLVVPASRFGKRTDVYNGVDLNVNARLPRGAFLGGGLTTGHTATNSCFVVDSPALNFCDVSPPYTSQVKLSGSYPLPWDVQVSAVFQSNAGVPIQATYVATTAEIARSLGRSLAGGTRTVTLNLFGPEVNGYDGRHQQLDLRLSKVIRVGRLRFNGRFDLYNLLNAASILQINDRYGPAWLTPGATLDARLAKIEVQVQF